RRIDQMSTFLQSVVWCEPNLFRNFELHLGGYFAGRSEVTLAFLHRVFEKLSEGSKAGATASVVTADEGEAESLYDDPELTPEAPETKAVPDLPILAQPVYDAVLRQGAVAFTVVSASKKGNVWMARDF